jgi:glycerol uptake facilitator-like aquaporin
MSLTKARRRQMILSWLGIVVGWGFSVGVGLVLLTEWLALVVPATTVGALGTGAFLTRRLLAPETRASITVEDLRGRPRPPARRR